MTREYEILNMIRNIQGMLIHGPNFEIRRQITKDIEKIERMMKEESQKPEIILNDGVPEGTIYFIKGIKSA